MVTNLSPDLAKTIRLQRRRRNMSQVQLGSLLKMPQSQIARIESGASDARVSTLVEIARALDLEPMLVPKHLVPAVSYMIQPAPAGSEQPKLVGNDPEELEDERA
jgi:HTH-type transcriptional regulator/antitoxin HipB